VIHGTMGIGHQYNQRTPILCLKILASGNLVTWFFNTPSVFSRFMNLLRLYFAIRWPPHEVAFRVNLDIWITYIGMLFAVGVNHFRDLRLAKHKHWPIVRNSAIAMSAAAICWYTVFELTQESKFTYNKWHPYISAIPILSFVVLRNSTEALRSSSSWAFIFIGKCSLETFIMQYHIWLAADTKGILFMIPFSKLRPLNFLVSSITFVWLSHLIAGASVVLTQAICDTSGQKDSNSLPGNTVEAHNVQCTGIRPQPPSWRHRLTIFTADLKESFYHVRLPGGLGARLILVLVMLWIWNITWR